MMLETISALARMKLDQWTDNRERQKVQLERLVAYANAKVPHYVKNPLPEEKEAMPLLDKTMIKADTLSFVSSDFKESGLLKIFTSGSSGTPMAIYFSEKERAFAFSKGYHIFTECGFGPLDLMCYVRANPSETGIAKGSGFFRFANIPMEDAESVQLRSLKEMKATMLNSYPSKLLLLALENEKSPHPARLKRVISHSELLTPAARKKICSSFGCPVRDLYGLNEMSWIAWECERGGMHVCPDVMAEAVGEDGKALPDGEAGEIVVTSLFRYSMPFIRYRTGDRGSLGGKCRCGRKGQLLRSLEGRATDSIILPSGRAWPGALLNMDIKKFEGILQFTVLQEEAGSFTLTIVPGEGFREKEEALLMDRLRSSLPEPMDIRLERAEKIKSLGKQRFVVSKVER
jgi:phenylacetate-CoA ligase